MTLLPPGVLDAASVPAGTGAAYMKVEKDHNRAL